MQRNRAVARVLPEIELISFLDDDVELVSDFLELTQRLFSDRPEVVALGENVLKEYVSRADARDVVRAAPGPASLHIGGSTPAVWL